MQEIFRKLGSHFLSFTERGLAYGPQGRMLLKNLEEHWFLHCVIMSRYNIFLSDGYAEISNFLTEAGLDDAPFGLASLSNPKNTWNQSVLLPLATCKVASHKTARITIINDPNDSKDLFHKVQKDRRVWWRKLARNPSRFKLTEPKKSKSSDSVDIEAQFPFGNIIVETVSYHTDTRKFFSQVHNCKKDVAGAQAVEHVVSLDWGSLALLCDTYSNDQLNETLIHSKLAPYKVAFYLIKSENEANTGSDDLNRFVLYLNNSLRTKGLSTILTGSSEIVNACLVPFLVLVDRTSLENGIVGVTSRSTSLTEKVHVSHLVKYIATRC